MKLSVLMVTYNHESYIAQALDSVLMQEVDFEYEIVVGEDCSTDSTRKIILDYYSKYPHKFKLLLHDNNQGACKNFLQSFKACNGDYIAYLEGDDYWTSKDKLQKQVDFLDSHPEYTICFHNCEEFYDDGDKPSWNYCTVGQKATSTLEDLLINCNFIPSCSVVFRNRLFDKFPDWYSELAIGDWTLHILNAQVGNIAYINEVMSRHRHHAGGVWSLRNQAKNILDVIYAYEVINNYLLYKYKSTIRDKISDYYNQLSNMHAKESIHLVIKYKLASLRHSNNKIKIVIRPLASFIRTTIGKMIKH